VDPTPRLVREPQRLEQELPPPLPSRSLNLKNSPSQSKPRRPLLLQQRKLQGLSLLTDKPMDLLKPMELRTESHNLTLELSTEL